VVYDGECGFCRSQIESIRRRAIGEAFEYLPRQTPGIESRFPQLREGDFNTGMRLILPDGTVHVGADATYQIARHLRRWRYLAWLYRVPGFHTLARAAYAWIARNRHTLSRYCSDASCSKETRS